MDKPSPPPSSNSCDVSRIWFVDKNPNQKNDSLGGLYPDENSRRMIYKGSNPDNYLNFNGELWRIISKESDGSYKIIKNESIGNMAYDDDTSNFWGKPCSLNTYLNSNYYDNLTKEAKNKIELHEFNVGLIGSNSLSGIESDENQTKWSGRVGTLSLSDYLKATLNNGNYIKSIISKTGNSIWLISGFKNNSKSVCNINSNGSVSSTTSNNVTYGVIPALYLNSDVNLSGSGSEEEPYIIA